LTRQLFKNYLYSTRTAEKWERLRRIVSPDDKVGVIIYGEPDPDSLAAGWALQYLLKPYAQSVKVLSTQPVQRVQNARFLNSLKIPVEFVDEVPWHEFTKLAVVDAQPNFFNPKPPVAFDIVIDHHPKKDNYSFKFSDVRPSYGSTSTMLLEYLVLAGRKVTKKMSTALWFGLKTDTDNISMSADAADVAAYGYLYHKSDRNLVQWLETSEIPIAFKDYYIKGLEIIEPQKKRLLVYLEDISKSDACVQLADFLSRFIGLRWIAVAGKCNGILYVILRGGAYGVDVGRIARRKLSAYGSAGGHKNKARAEIPVAVLEKELPNTTNEEIDRWLRGILIGSRRKKS